MKERQIPLYPHEVRGILAGRQSQLRRVVKGAPTQSNVADYRIRDGLGQAAFYSRGAGRRWEVDAKIRCPYGKPGDRLWVRETHAIINGDPYDAVLYRETPGIYYAGRWRPSIHMPRWASRITLGIKSISVERLQDISEEDVWAEGWYEIAKGNTDFENFGQFWESINGPGSWDANPWVWKIEFERTPAGGNE